MRPSACRRSRFFRPAWGANAPDAAREDFSKICSTCATSAVIAALTRPPTVLATGRQCFFILFLSVIVVGLAIWLELAVKPAAWVHLAVGHLVIGVGSMAMPHPAKSTLFAMH